MLSCYVLYVFVLNRYIMQNITFLLCVDAFITAFFSGLKFKCKFKYLLNTKQKYNCLRNNYFCEVLIVVWHMEYFSYIYFSFNSVQKFIIKQEIRFFFFKALSILQCSDSIIKNCFFFLVEWTLFLYCSVNSFLNILLRDQL